MAAQGGAGVRYPADHGLTVLLGGPGRWRLEDGARTAYLEAAAPGDDQVEACAMCHSRRSQVWPERHPGDALAQTHRLQLLGEGYYFPDGQILDEVFVYGSFRQSKMYDMGVTCADCHEPHSLKLRAEGNNVCATCHTPSFYDSPEHHFHEMGTDGARCVSCHMPTRDYMVVDPRLDHSLRVPRPDRTISMGTPNACNQCHTDQEAQWAQDAIVEWYGDDRRPGHQTYAEAFHAARLGAPGAGEQLVGVAMDEAVPAIARATALEELARHLTPDALPAIEAGLGAADPLMRRAAIEALAPVDPGTRWPLVSPLLDDPVRTVRLAAAGALTDVRPVQLDEAGAAALAGAFEEYLASEMSNADRAEHWVNLAGFHLAQGDVAAMERDFAEARRRNPRFMPAYANQADMYRALGREEDAEHVLMMGLKALPDSPHLHFALALALVRAQRHDEALSELETAYGLGPEDARIGYVYAVALDSAGRRDDAIRVWQEVLGRHPNDVDTLQALASTLYREGRPEEALDHARRLATLVPQDPAAAQLLAAIRQALDG